MMLMVFVCIAVSSCSSDDDEVPSGAGHHSSLFGEWVETGGKYSKIADFYEFESNGKCQHGTYEFDTDWVDYNDEYTWYTVDNKYLYIDNVKYEYGFSGSTLVITRNGNTRRYREK